MYLDESSKHIGDHTLFNKCFQLFRLGFTISDDDDDEDDLIIFETKIELIYV